MMMHRSECLPLGVAQLEVSKLAADGRHYRSLDYVAEEVPVALVFNGISHAVMMATPSNLEDFALGFGLTEGLLEHPDELYSIEIESTRAGIELQLQVSAACEWRLKDRRKNLAGRTGCGICGAEGLEQIRRTLQKVQPVEVSSDAIHTAQAQLSQWQQLQQLTGATHAAAWADSQGRIIHLREDVGRHNALDKLIGLLVREKLAPSAGFVCITSRASFEMVQKTIAFGAGLLCAVSAPTALAIETAARHDLRLLGFVRPHQWVAYTMEMNHGN
jgi:FdhD protein